MSEVPRLGHLLDCPALLTYTDSKTWFTDRDAIKGILAEHLVRASTQHWLPILESAGIWCAEVLDWPQLLAHDAFKVLNMLQQVSRANGATLTTTRCPIHIDGTLLTSPVGAPTVGEHTDSIIKEFNL